MVSALDETEEEPAGATLRRTARELRKVVGMVEDLEQVVGQTLMHSPRPHREQMLELQKLDHIQQKILGVSDFLEALGEDMAQDWLVRPKRASRCVLLAELAAKLGDASPAFEDPPSPSAEPAPESYELF